MSSEGDVRCWQGKEAGRKNRGKEPWCDVEGSLLKEKEEQGGKNLGVTWKDLC